jgi:predicted AlkP superfamily pyrophosphatase or phosphodiesterase
MNKTVVINTVALTRGLVGDSTPHLSAFLKKGKLASIKPIVPAVTCSVQSTYLTGKYPSEHGIVGNGWYFKDEAEVKFWKQSNNLVQGEKIWHVARKIDPTFTVSNMFWWFNMYAAVDYSVTPRPMYPVDGRKLPDIYTEPSDLRPMLQEKLGQFPLFEFWGPRTTINATKWIAEATKIVDKEKNPTLTLIYLPHLDYGFQKYGPDSPEAKSDLREVDEICADLINYYEAQGAQVIVLAEYGIMPVTTPIHVNRVLREKGFLEVREELGKELLDAGKSRAFAVADHQIAHVYVKDAKDISTVKNILRNMEGIDEVMSHDERKKYHLDHLRAGDIVLISKPETWFTYYYWLDDSRAPDFGRTVDIHRKPGYDPVELFINPKIRFPTLYAGWKLLQKKLGFRYVMDVIPLDATLVKGSHGRIPEKKHDYPVFITNKPELLAQEVIEATAVHDLILKHLIAVVK